jgi:hypothetical protein
MSSILDEELEQNTLKGKIKKIYLNFTDVKKFNITFFLLGCIQLYFIAELIKSSSLIEKDKKNYDNCYSIISKHVIKKDSIRICQILNHQENFQGFVYNLFFTLIFSYSLIREVIKKKYMPISYWFVSSLSILGYSLMTELDSFKFSLDSERDYTSTQILIISIFSIVITFLITRQLWYRKIKILTILKFCSTYLFLYILLYSVTNSIIIHFHHSFVSGILSLCFSDLDSKIDLYIHAILLGIFIQGLNFFDIGEITMFYIDNFPSPNFNYMIFLNLSFFGFLLLLYLFKKFLCKNRKKQNRSSIELPLLNLDPSYDQL